jgi:hypothetical protein
MHNGVDPKTDYAYMSSNVSKRMPNTITDQMAASLNKLTLQCTLIENRICFCWKPLGRNMIVGNTTTLYHTHQTLYYMYILTELD